MGNDENDDKSSKFKDLFNMKAWKTTPDIVGPDGDALKKDGKIYGPDGNELKNAGP